MKIGYRFGLLMLAVCVSALFTPDVVAQDGDSLTVVVRDADEEFAIDGADVTVYNAQEQEIASGSTDAEGEVVFWLDASLSVDQRSRLHAAFLSPRPNPFSSQSTVPFRLESTGTVRATVYDMYGRAIVTSSRVLPPGGHALDFTLAGEPDGAYILDVQFEGVSVASFPLRYQSGANRDITSLSFVPGVGSNGSLEKRLAAGTYSLVVSHPEYATAEVTGVAVSDVHLETVLLQPIEPLPDVPEFGTDETRSYNVIVDVRNGLSTPRDLEFNPAGSNELWVVNRNVDGTVTIWNPGTDSAEYLVVTDEWGRHFMEEVSAISFGVDGLFGTAQESNNTYNGAVPGNNFMGPALWTSDTSIYSKQDRPGWGDLGSHLDMLHESPWGMGIAHDTANVYWYYDGHYGNVVRYDFADDHGPGWDDHSDGIVRRYMDAQVTREPDVPGHMILDQESKWLYICDPGASRVTRLDTRSGSWLGIGNIDGSQMELLAEYSRYGNATYEVVANTDLVHPSGIALHEDRLFVTDNSTGEIVAYTTEGEELARIQTPAAAIMGIEIGPDGRIWYVDAETNQVVRVDIAED